MPQGKSALSVVQKYDSRVTRVIDAKKGFTVQVLAKDCKAGVSGAPDDCAVAKACKREYDGAIISKAVAYLIKGTTAYRYRVPSAIRTEIVSFDRNRDFRPGEYTLNAPYTTERLGWIRKERKRVKAVAVAAPPVSTAPLKAKVKKVVRRSHKVSGVRNL